MSKSSDAKAEARAKKIAKKTHQFLTDVIVKYLQDNKYEEDGEAIFTVACSIVAFATEMVNNSTDLEPQETFAYISDVIASSLGIELEYESDLENEDHDHASIDKKLLN